MDDHFLTKVEKLSAIGRAQDLEFDSVVARVAVDQFCSLDRPSQAEIERFVAVMLEALPRTDPVSAVRIAEKLVHYANAPEIVLAGLLERDSVAAATIFRLAPRLSSALMLRRAESGSYDEAIAIAGRPDLDLPVVAALARRTETEPLRALAANDAAHIDSGALPVLVQRGRFDAPLARALLRRPELGLRALPLFLWANSDTRRRLVVETQRSELANMVRAPSPLEAIRPKALSAGRAANRAGFATVIALALKTGRAAIDRMIDDEGGEPLALIFAATGAEAAISTDAIAMLRPDLASSDRVRLALATSASAAGRIIVATTGRAGLMRQAGEYARPVRSETRDASQGLAPRGQATMFNRG